MKQADRHALYDRLAGVSGPGQWRPELFDLSDERDRTRVTDLLSAGLVRACHDGLSEQLAELLATRDPAARGHAVDWRSSARAHLGGTPEPEYGRWVFYPWSGRLVHVLPAAEYRELRSNRNQFRIGVEEIGRLRSARVGVIGLSVGHTIAVTMALEGVGGCFRLADPDALDLSNLNRLPASTADLGQNKAVLAARRIAELDPYLEVEVFPSGISEDDAEDFLELGGRLDLVVEECDDLLVKVLVRELARARGIPVLMETNDRGMLDVELFDREPDRPLFHGLIPDLRTEALAGLSTKDKVPFVLRLLGEDRMSEPLRASLTLIEERLVSWPQLGSAVTLGAGVATDVARRILLGQHSESGRYYVDLHELVRDGAAIEIEEGKPLGIQVAKEARTTSRPLAVPLAGSRQATPDEVRFIVDHGILAPSAHNGQPWRFDLVRGRLAARIVDRHPMPMLDFERGATHLAFGAVATNMELAAAQLGLSMEPRFFPDAADPDLVFTAALRRGGGPRAEPDLLAQQRERVTNRRLGPRIPLGRAEAEALLREATVAGAQLRLVEDEEALEALGCLLGRGDRLCFLGRRTHGELMSGFRWDLEEVTRTRDGLDVATLELSAAEVAGMRVMSSWRVARFVRHLGGGSVLEKLARKAVRSASAVGLITVAGTGPRSYLRGGQAMQRVWLRATELGLSVQPLAMLPYLFARLERGRAEGLERAEVDELGALRRGWHEVFEPRPGDAEALLFRVSRAEPPTARALRRPVDEVLHLGG